MIDSLFENNRAADTKKVCCPFLYCLIFILQHIHPFPEHFSLDCVVNPFPPASFRWFSQIIRAASIWRMGLGVVSSGCPHR